MSGANCPVFGAAATRSPGNVQEIWSDLYNEECTCGRCEFCALASSYQTLLKNGVSVSAPYAQPLARELERRIRERAFGSHHPTPPE